MSDHFDTTTLNLLSSGFPENATHERGLRWGTTDLIWKPLANPMFFNLRKVQRADLETISISYTKLEPSNFQLLFKQPLMHGLGLSSELLSTASHVHRAYALKEFAATIRKAVSKVLNQNSFLLRLYWVSNIPCYRRISHPLPPSISPPSPPPASSPPPPSFSAPAPAPPSTPFREKTRYLNIPLVQPTNHPPLHLHPGLPPLPRRQRLPPAKSAYVSIPSSHSHPPSLSNIA